MRKTPAVAMIVILALVLGSAAPLLLQAQNGGVAPRLGPAPDDMPRRTAKAFAPFLRAIIMRRTTTAQQIFKMRRPVMTALDHPDTLRILGRFQKPDTLALNLVGGRMLGESTGILLFTIASVEGPVYIKIYYYGVEDVIYIDRMDIGDDWDDMEAAAISVQSLPSPITVSLGSIDDGAGQ